MSVVMGLDQHRGQITGEWIDTETGEVQRTRVAPADRDTRAFTCGPRARAVLTPATTRPPRRGLRVT